ncbi:MAG: hypothetical protein U0324_09990 [Polyangiales bacterium]
MQRPPALLAALWFLAACAPSRLDLGLPDGALAPDDTAAEDSPRAAVVAPADAAPSDVASSPDSSPDAVAPDAPTPDVAPPDAAADAAPTPDVIAAPDAPAGTPCPTSIAGNGLPCASPGEGCGGGGTCGDLYACSCNASGRWQCTAMRVPCDAGAPDAPPPADAAVDAGSPVDVPRPPDAPPACSLVGTYSFRSPIGTTMYLRMRADGMWAYATTTSALDRSTLNGAYTTAGDLVTIRETGTSLEGCLSSETGVYRLSFSAGCSVGTLALVSDACRLRGALLGGRSFTRM